MLTRFLWIAGLSALLIWAGYNALAAWLILGAGALAFLVPVSHARRARPAARRRRAAK